MDHGAVTVFGFVGPERDAIELLEFAKEVLDEVAPLLHLLIDRERLTALRSLRDDYLGAARVHVFNDHVAVIGLVSQQGSERDAQDQRRYTDSMTSVTGQKCKADKASERVRHDEDSCLPSTFRLSDSLILSSPFAP